MPDLSQYGYGTHRGWEILPGALVWGTLLGAVLLSFLAPTAAIIFIIVFDLLWLYRVAYFVIQLFLAWSAYRRAMRTDWEAKLKTVPRADRLRHLVFLPTYQEEYPILRETLRSLRAARFPTQRMFIVLAGEARDAERFRRNAALAQREFGHAFGRIFVTEHPAGLPGEIPGKGSNLHWAARQVAEELARLEPDLRDEDVIVSAFDVDTIAHPQYFACLAYLYATVPDPTHTSFQPVALFSNNIWSAPAPVRIAAFGTTFWLMGELARPERLWTFSSHSMPWKMLKDVGFWQKDVVSEDSRIFLQAFLHYHGGYRVTPLFLPISLDTVVGRTYLEALRALYKQQRRWAWGVEHLPVMVEAFKADRLIPLRKKVWYVFNHLEGMYTWATAPILIFLMGWLPLALTSGQGSAFVQAAPYTLQLLIRGSMIGVFVSATLSLTLLPPRPRHARLHRWAFMLLQWALLPVTFVVFGSLPALDAQTRLMLGTYLGFNVTKKRR